MSESEMDFAEMLAQSEISSQPLVPGQKLAGTVISVGADDVFLNLGRKEDGIMDRKDLLDASGNLTVATGDQVEGYVIGLTSQGIRLSRSMSGSGVAALEEARDAQIPVEGRVAEACKGGYHVTVLGRQAFCPGSQMDNEPGVDPVGMNLEFLITRIENHGRNIVVSRRALRDKLRSESLDRLLEGLKIGDIIEGPITRLAPYGAFVELAPAVEGMVHLSELGWSRVDKPEDVVSPGDVVRAKVLSLDTADRRKMRIGLSIKQAGPDPWEDVAQRFHQGDTVTGIVRRLAPFGAFVELAPGIEGLVHVSEMDWTKRILNPAEVVNPGDSVQVRIKELDLPSRRISLSLRDASANPWTEARFAPGAEVAGTVDANTKHGLFVLLDSGITGLLPASLLKSSPAAQELGKLQKGDPIEVVVESFDPASQRLSLAPRDARWAEKQAEKSWREHVDRQAPAGTMAEALQRAFQKKGQSR